jgi:hypothetical protein
MTIESAAVSSKNNGQNSVKIRIFVALFDYDPPTMSPNPDACDEELPFREGQLIKVNLKYLFVIFKKYFEKFCDSEFCKNQRFWFKLLC